MILHFDDKSVTYETFLDDLSSRLVHRLRQEDRDPEYVSQRKAYSIFGRRNVDRWRRNGRVKFSKRPGKVEYRMKDLRLLQRTEQDYFDR